MYSKILHNTIYNAHTLEQPRLFIRLAELRKLFPVFNSVMQIGVRPVGCNYYLNCYLFGKTEKERPMRVQQ
jgi:hypothetical protein